MMTFAHIDSAPFSAQSGLWFLRRTSMDAIRGMSFQGYIHTVCCNYVNVFASKRDMLWAQATKKHVFVLQPDINLNINLYK